MADKRFLTEVQATQGLDATAIRVNGTLLASSHLSDAAVICHTNTNEVIANSWTFGASTTFQSSWVGRASGATAHIDLVAGNATNTGYIQWYNPSNLRLGYLGFDNNELSMQVENGAMLALTTGVGNTALTVEQPALQVNNASLTFAGNVATQRSSIFVGPTLAGDVAGRVITTAATVAITAPAAGTNMTITNPYALWVQSGVSRFDGIIESANVLKPSAALARLRIQGANAGAGVTEMWDRLSLSAAHAFGSFPDPGAGGLYANGVVNAASFQVAGVALASTNLSDTAALARLASPTFTGTPTLPTGTIAVTQTAGNSTTAIATTAFVTTADNLKANLASPALTGTPTVNGQPIAGRAFSMAMC